MSYDDTTFVVDTLDVLNIPLSDTLPQMPLASPGTTSRPRTLPAKCGVNPLVTSAAGLLALVEKLRESSTYRDISTLAEQLTHEIKSFEINAQKQGYPADMILLARYILCTTTDELISYTSWGSLGLWEEHKLLSAFQNEPWGGERFFLILERASADPNAYIDLLELMYLCLSMGYEGKYRLLDQNKTQLDKIIDKLYHSIRWQRGEMKKNLLVTPSKLESTHVSSHVSLWLLIVLAGSLLLTGYVSFSFLLARNAAPLFQQLQTAKTVLLDLR
jgi:type VI secretion system protein ImpK